MKTAYPYIAATLLVAYVVYSLFVPITIAHSMILFSLAGLAAYNQFLLSRSTPKLEDEIAKLKRELQTQMEKQKELHDKKLSELEAKFKHC
jgi:hypothetical protein